MRRPLAIGATLIVALAAPGTTAAQNQFSAGSAKTDIEVLVVGDEHASFSAHNVGTGCEAMGQVVYSGPTAGFTAKITELRIDPVDLFYRRASLRGVITKAVSGVAAVGLDVRFDVADSGLPGGTGDEFQFIGASVLPDVQLCDPPLAGHVITSGNIVIKTT